MKCGVCRAFDTLDLAWEKERPSSQNTWSCDVLIILKRFSWPYFSSFFLSTFNVLVTVSLKFLLWSVIPLPSLDLPFP